MADLSGRTCLITGASSGIGRAAAHALAQQRAELVLLCRNPRRGEETVAEIERESGRRPELLLCDLGSQAQIRKAADEFLASDRPLHVLLNNAGLLNLRRQVSEDGIEMTFAVNHLGYFLLTLLLLDRIKATAPARIVNVASDAHRWGSLDFEDLDAEKRYRSMSIYGRSKLANILFTRELARRLEGTGVTANCMHPGSVGTRLGSNNGLIARVLLPLWQRIGRSPEKGAETAVYLCSSPEVEGVSGRYFYDCHEHAPGAAARSDSDAQRLWQVSAQLTGLS